MNAATHLGFRSAVLLALCALATIAEADTPPPTKPIACSRQKAVLGTPDSRSAKVSIADLDLNTPRGAEAARKRLDQVARHLCQQVADEGDLSKHANYLACVDETLAKALQQAVLTNGKLAAR
jgi:UrcA family protein